MSLGVYDEPLLPRVRAHSCRPVYSLILGTKIFIVLSSDTVVKDLLDKRSNLYSSRPDMYMGMDLASGGLRVLLMVNPPPSSAWLVI